MTKLLPSKERAEMVLSFECPRCNHRAYVSMEHIFNALCEGEDIKAPCENEQCLTVLLLTLSANWIEIEGEVEADAGSE